MTFPDYSHWGGQIVRAILNGESFSLSRGNEETGAFSGTFRQEKHPYIFQMLQSVDRVHRQEEIHAGLMAHHWVMDRYDVDALAYGLVDGCSMEWLLSMQNLYRPSDLAIIYVGEPFPRPGEIPDLNERDSSFQQRVATAYQGLANLFPSWFTVMDINPFRHEDTLESIFAVHTATCSLLSERLKLQVSPLSRKQVAGVLNPFAISA
jgi:thymidylate kinase